MSEKLERHQTPYIQSDLTKKMVLVAGPRQCGKTTEAKRILSTYNTGAYYSWDIHQHRLQLRNLELDADARLWVFDELHKYRQWRNWLKGIFDEYSAQHPILVPGSARQDIYSRGGDSLQGRYFKHRMHPVTLSELLATPSPTSLDEIIENLKFSQTWSTIRKEATSALVELLTLGGFPEPLCSSSAVHAQRWRLSYGELLVREDIRTLESIRDLDRLELLFERLPDCVGSILSINSLREDLEVAFETIKNWLSILENTYAIFRVPPFGPAPIKAVKKEQKLYCWDWSRVKAPGARFENLIAVHLLRFVHWAEDIFGEKIELRYIRDVVGHEVDFVVLRKQEPWFIVECKLQKRTLDPNIKYMVERIKVPYVFQICAEDSEHHRLPQINSTDIHLMSAAQFLLAFP